MFRQFLFTSESVAEGHPDKLADLLADTILDTFLSQDPTARVACEIFITHNLVVIGGEYRTKSASLFEQTAKAWQSALAGLRWDFCFLGGDWMMLILSVI